MAAGTTVDEWKVAIQRCSHPATGPWLAATEADRSRRVCWVVVPLALVRFPRRRPRHRLPASSRTPTVSVHEIQALGRSTKDVENGETWTWERQEGEPQGEVKPEQLQQVAVRSGQKTTGSGGNYQRGGSGWETRRLGSHLTVDERLALFKVGRCWNCCEKGHVAARCPSLDKQGFPRKPRAEQLKG